MAKRFDAGEYRKAKVLANGWLRADAVLTRAGVFEYLNADGTVRREFRPPEEVFHADSLGSFQMLPVTDDHPACQMLDAANAKDLTRGHVGDNIRRDGLLMTGSVMITDADLVKKALDKTQSQISLGYTCELDETPGSWNGERYDAVQRNIRGNHVAVVKQGRAGIAALRLDTADSAVQLVTEPPNARRALMDTIRIDGMDYTPAQAAQVIAKRDTAHAEALKAAEKARADAASEVEKLKARADGLESDLKKVRAELEAAKDPKHVSALVAARVAVETEARKVLGAEVKLDGMDDKAIRAAMLAKLEPELKLEGKSDDYVQGRLDHALARLDAENPGASVRAAVETPPAPGAQRNDSVSARDRMLKAAAEAWKQPLKTQLQGVGK